ncbi:DNA polymerase IV [Labeo rohita]|uniref:DNA polymerase IV n=2 Tax=Labeo rohita TaxID=84645 RepID=A0ABQ8LG11_LABRO|nr:DNA polymerase IV [Labeo rohita]
MTQRQNTVSENSLQIHIVEVNSILPMIEWIPESSHEQMTEETTSWRCEGFVSAKHETRSPEALWKKASGQKIEWCRERLAKAAHLGSSPTAARPRVVIRRLARGRGHRGTSSHKEQKLKPLVNHKDLHNSYYSHSTLKNRYGCLCSPVQPRLRHSTDQRDAAQTLDMKQQCQEREFSNATGDIRCHSGCPKDAESPTTPHHVTLSHILQVLQSKPANFPEVRGQRCHRAL